MYATRDTERKITALLADIVLCQMNGSQLDSIVEQAITNVRTLREELTTNHGHFELSAQWKLADDTWRKEYSTLMRLYTLRLQNSLAKELSELQAHKLDHRHILMASLKIITDKAEQQQELNSKEGRTGAERAGDCMLECIEVLETVFGSDVGEVVHDTIATETSTPSKSNTGQSDTAPQHPPPRHTTPPQLLGTTFEQTIPPHLITYDNTNLQANDTTPIIDLQQQNPPSLSNSKFQNNNMVSPNNSWDTSLSSQLYWQTVPQEMPAEHLENNAMSNTTTTHTATQATHPKRHATVTHDATTPSKKLRLSNIEHVFVRGENNILSNFAYTPFIYQNKTYTTVEHAYQTCKANHFHDFRTAEKIMNTTSPATAKSLTKHLSNPALLSREHKPHYTSWTKHRTDTLYRLMTAKFVQDNTARDALLRTESANIHHNVPDKYWGTGYQSTEVRQGYFGENHFGNLLQIVRSDLTGNPRPAWTNKTAELLATDKTAAPTLTSTTPTALMDIVTQPTRRYALLPTPSTTRVPLLTTPGAPPSDDLTLTTPALLPTPLKHQTQPEHRETLHTRPTDYNDLLKCSTTHFHRREFTPTRLSTKTAPKISKYIKDAQTLILSDSQLQRVTDAKHDKPTAIFAISGLTLELASKIINHSETQPHITELILALGINNHAQDPTSTSFKHFTTLIFRAKHTFPNAKIFFPDIAYNKGMKVKESPRHKKEVHSNHLPTLMIKIRGWLNRKRDGRTEHMAILELPQEILSFSSNAYHLTTSSATYLTNHWLQQIRQN